ncbi:RCC1 domain-containing protein [Archangium lansingense]|uniref:RCC1-like domain-containing protein n=1 Tax=Archangium lansingense TaxID=2995310 RepID=A0ABT4AGL4_9BACT|nr:hypothetical protein [Archangium lansinium]MCY1080726.1 hypothetical protein [Archangium lansinium]
MKISALLLAVCHLLVIATAGCKKQDPVALGSSASEAQHSPSSSVRTYSPRDEATAGGYVDASGHEHLVPIRVSTASRAAMNYPGCGDDYIDNHSISYKGYSLDYTTCSSGSPQPSAIHVRWTHDIPSDIALDVTSSGSTAKLKFDSGAYQTIAPISVRPIGTYTHPGSGIAMTRYQVEYAVNMGSVNYCATSNFTSSYRLATDCDEVPVVFPTTKTDSLSPNTYKVHPYIAKVSSGSRAFTVSPGTLPCSGCHDPALGDSPEHLFEYRKKGTTTWTVIQRTNLSNFRVPVPSAGIYEYRSKGKLTIGGAYSDYTEIQTVTVSDYAEVVAGVDYSLALRPDGTVWASGSGPLGDGSSGVNRFIPVQVQGLSEIVTVAAGGSHALAVRSDGTVWSWGENYDGQLGDGTYIAQKTPVQVHGLSGVVAVSAGFYHSLALRSDGTVWSWGENHDGRLGDGTNNTHNTPVQVLGLSGVVAVSTGFYHSLALRSDGTLFAWGNNDFGQLGDGSTTDRFLPVQVQAPSEIKTMDGGLSHSLAVLSDGTVLAWGRNAQGQLGNGSTTDSLLPQHVQGLSAVTAVSAGLFDHSLAVHSNGTVSAWGENNNGQVGDGSMINRLTPVQVQGLTSAVAVSAGGSHSLALLSDGTAWAWGSNSVGQRADGSFREQPVPMQLDGLSNVVAVAAGGYHSLALRSDGTVWGWGQNNHGQLGNGTTSEISTLVQVQGLNNVIAIATGPLHSLAVHSNGTVWAWGNNSCGQLGDGTTSSRLTPVQVQGLSDAKAVAAGHLHSLVRLSDGYIKAWGYNFFGQLGDGTITSRSMPGYAVNWVWQSVAIAAGDNHSMAIGLHDGNAWTWGDNSVGQMGGSGDDKYRYAMPVQDMSGVVAVAAGGLHSLVLRNDGSVWAWGANSKGQLGDGTNSTRYWPVQMQGLSDAMTVAAGGEQSAAVRTNGTFWTWGGSRVIGQQSNTTPIQAGTLDNGRSVAVGYEHFVGLRWDGTVWVWGDNSYGQLGSGLPTGVLTATRSQLL